MFGMKFKQVADNSLEATNTIGGLCYIDYQCDGFYLTYALSGKDADLVEHDDSFDTLEEAVKVAETIVPIQISFEDGDITDSVVIVQ